MITYINTTKPVGTEGIPVQCECEITKGIGIHLIGLADAAVKESLLRTVTALQAKGYHIPGDKIVINLAPADLFKSGCGYDLAIALGIIASSGQEELDNIDDYVVLGELGLDGSVRDVTGWMQAADVAYRSGKSCILPYESALQAAEVYKQELVIYGIRHLQEAIDILNGYMPKQTAYDLFLDSKGKDTDEKVIHWDEIRGQNYAKRALEIAAAGGHNILLMGAPGSGKSTLAKALMDILPPLTEEEAKTVQRIYSAGGRHMPYGQRPFRAPHYSCSMAAMFGGGYGENVAPGEISLAHNGVLHLDDIVEMPKSMTESLRGPLEDKKVTISRLKSKVDFPAHFQLVAKTNPCPCGYYGEGDRCTCTPGQRAAYLSHLSGPVYEQLDIQVWAHQEKSEAVVTGDPAAIVAERVAKARKTQILRQGKLNCELTASEIYNIQLKQECKELMDKLLTHLGLSARSYSRILRIARTIADLDGSENIEPIHLSEASTFRFIDKIKMQKE